MDSPSEALAAQVAWNFGSWRTIDIRVRTDLNNPNIEVTWNRFDEHYVESRAGGRYSDRRSLKDDTFSKRIANYCDGSKSATVNFREKDADLQKSVIIKRDFSDEDRVGKSAQPAPLQFFYVARTPLQEALPKSTYLGIDRVNGRECKTFLFAKVKHTVGTQELVYSLDAATGTPLKVVSYIDEPSRIKGTPIWTWTCDKLESTQGHEIPAVSTSTSSYVKDGKTVVVTHKFTVESIKFDQDYPASTFWPVIQPGVPVMDSLAKKVYETPGAKLPEKVSATTVATQPLVAAPPRDWSSTVSSITLGLGLAVLIAGGVLWWRRR